jgi:hypothetical protein
MAKRDPRISWSIEEYAYREKGPDWYWALGVIAIAGAAIAVITDNPLFAIFIILGAIILGFYAHRKPDILDVSISDEGITIKNYLYPYEKIKGFAVDEHELGNFLLIESDRAIVPIISIPIPEGLDGDALTELLKTKIEEKPIKEPASHRIMEHLGF